jgi:hypothetical protein
MFHAKENWLSCVLEVMISHIDLTAKKTSAFPAEIQKQIDAMHENHKALSLPKQVGHVIGIPKKMLI